jgi:hypothetical protein
MYGCDTGSMPAIHLEQLQHLEHLEVRTASRLNTLIGKLKRAKFWNARIMLFLNGGHVDGMEPIVKIKLPED